MPHHIGRSVAVREWLFRIPSLTCNGRPVLSTKPTARSLWRHSLSPRRACARGWPRREPQWGVALGRIAILPCAPGPPCCGLQSCREWQSRVRRVLFLCAPSRRLRKAMIISKIMSPIVVGDTADTRSTHIYELIASSRCVCGVDTTFGDASFCATGRRGRLRRWGALVCRWCKSIL